MVEKRSRKERLEARFRRLKAKFLQEILAPERLVILSIPAILLVWLIGSISSLSRNWSLQQEIAEKETELAYLELQVDNFELENEYYSSEEYQELAARKLQNKKLSGETLVYLPKNTERAKSRYRENTNEEKAILNEKSNLDQWLTFLFGA
ncbi:hypothetical protein IJI76_03080 [Candidatus Saccharibacteria bacterium]|nr:hypothetical protein [Candidatus Saccharibacteria bacterium]